MPQSPGTNSTGEAVKTLEPLLSQKTPFLLLDHAGRILGKQMAAKQKDLFAFMDGVEATKAMGGYVIIASALGFLLDHDLHRALNKAKEYIAKGDVWYVADTMGERVLGQALVEHFPETLPILGVFRTESNPWVKRSVGVAVHYYAKRVRNNPEKAERLLRLLSPYFDEKDIRIVKGIGWGLKTLGRYYPDLLVDFLKSQKGRKPSRILIKKVLTYLPEGGKAGIKVLWY